MANDCSYSQHTVNYATENGCSYNQPTLKYVSENEKL